MKMGFLFSGVFWGVLVILIGLSIILKAVFNVNFPIVRMGIALIFIYLGLKILLGGFGVPMVKNGVLFGEANIVLTTDNREYNVIFGKGNIDATQISIGDETVKMEINTIFGGSFMKLNPDIPVKLKVDAVFGGAKLPDGNTAAFGSYTYTSRSYREGEKHILINASVVFGGFEVTE
ncbi:hypothetical protein ACFL6D_04505 [Spirochaetota bacterium]